MFWLKKGLNGREYREETSRKISWGHWFAFFNIIIAILIGSRYAFLIDWPDTLSGKLYFFISLFGHFSFCVFALYLLVIFPLSFLIKNHRSFRGLTVIIATICTTLLLFDTEVFEHFNLHLSSVVWNLLVNPENGELSREWQIFFAPMPIILLLQMLFSRWSWEKLRSLERQKWLKKVGLVLTLAFIATHLIYAWADAVLYRPITMQRSNFPLSYPMTARTFLEKQGFIDRQEYTQKIEQEGRLDAQKIHYPKTALNFAPMENKPNILVVTVSGLRFDAITPDSMPKLAEFAQSSAQFTHHYSTGNTNNAGLVGLFYGLNANYTDSILASHTASPWLSKMRAEKYQFGLFSATNFKDSLFKQALFRNNLPAKISGGNLGAVNAFSRFMQQQQADKPWFAFVDLDISADNAAQYQGALTAIDDLWERLLASVDLQNTLVIVTAEHGTSFEKLSEKEAENYFAREVIQVPLLVFWKNLPVGEYSQLSSHTDILPALMEEIFLVKNPSSDYSQGHNLFNLAPDNWVLAANFRQNVIITPDGTQYHIDSKGNYQKYNADYQEQSSARPPLGLFLEVFKQERTFFEK